MIESRLVTAFMVVFVGAASAGAVLADDDKAEDARELAALAGAKVSLAEAITAAQGLVPGGTVLQAVVDTENGAPTYVVDLEKNGVQRVLIDIRSGEAKTAAIEADNIEKSKDDDDDDDDDDDEDDED